MPYYFLKSNNVDISKYNPLLLAATLYSIICNHHLLPIHSLSDDTDIVSDSLAPPMMLR